MSTLGLADDLLFEADSPKPELIEPPSPIASSSRTPDAKPGSSPAAPTPPAGEPEGDEAAQGLVSLSPITWQSK